MSLSEPSIGYRPFRFPWAYEMWERQQNIHWLPKEISLADDIQQFGSMDPAMRSVVVNIFRMFVQSDIDVHKCYHKVYQQHFKPTEIQMMLSSFSNMECFDRESELLTDAGWKKCPDITENDNIAQYDIETRAISFVKPDRVVSYHYNGVMHHYSNRSTNICVTPNHELILENPASRKVSKRKSYEGSWGRNYLYPSAGYAVGLRDEPTSLEKIFIAVAADGSLRGLCHSAPKSRTVDVKFSKKRKIDMMRSLLVETGTQFTERKTTSGSTNFCFSAPEELNIAGVKSLDFINIGDLSALGAEVMLNEILWWDGSHNGKNCYFYSTNSKAVDKAQALAVLAGKGTSISVNRTAEQSMAVVLPNGKTPQSTKDCFVLCVSDRCKRTYPKRQEVDYDGLVYCVSVPTQNLVSRRFGKVAMTGNTVHIAAYSHLLDSLGLPDSMYHDFMEYEEMKAKHDFMESFDPQNPLEVALSLAGVSAFGEGLQLFASFAVLLNFPRQNLLSGMGQIVSWSVRDESLHCEGIMRLYHAWVAEHPEIDRALLSKCIHTDVNKVVASEDRFVDLVFKMGDIPGMTREELKRYIRYMANYRLRGLGEPDAFKVEANPFPWVDTLAVGIEHANFFERQGTEYSKAATVGEWGDVFS